MKEKRECEGRLMEEMHTPEPSALRLREERRDREEVAGGEIDPGGEKKYTWKVTP